MKYARKRDGRFPHPEWVFPFSSNFIPSTPVAIHVENLKVKDWGLLDYFNSNAILLSLNHEKWFNPVRPAREDFSFSKNFVFKIVRILSKNILNLHLGYSFKNVYGSGLIIV